MSSSQGFPGTVGAAPVARPALTAVLFDFDGTIVDTESALLASWVHEYALAGQKLTPQEWAGQAGRGHVDHYAVLAELTGPTFDVSACQARRRSHQDELLRTVGPRAGITEALSLCTARNILTAIVSSSPREWVLSELVRTGLTHHFDALICREDVTDTKPDPMPYLTALRQLDVNADAALAVEDAPSGVVSAMGAGLSVIAIPNDVTSHLPVPPGAHALADSRSLPAVLQSYLDAPDRRENS